MTSSALLSVYRSPQSLTYWITSLEDRKYNTALTWLTWGGAELHLPLSPMLLRATSPTSPPPSPPRRGRGLQPAPPRITADQGYIYICGERTVTLHFRLSPSVGKELWVPAGPRHAFPLWVKAGVAVIRVASTGCVWNHRHFSFTTWERL